MTKLCTKCCKEKPLIDFYCYLSGRQRGQIKLPCKACSRERVKIKESLNPEHRESRRIYERTRYAENVEYRNYIKQKSKSWVLKNPGRARAYARNYVKNRSSIDFDYRFRKLLRSSLSKILDHQGLKKADKTERLLGCPIADFRTHLELLFWPGMSWQNQGRWHLDHIKPCASFDLSDPAQQAACFHWSNWQPLWADDNMAKSDRLDWHPAESQHSLPARLTSKPWDCEGLGNPTLSL